MRGAAGFSDGSGEFVEVRSQSLGDLSDESVLLFFPLLRDLRTEVSDGLVPSVSLPDNPYRVVFHPLLASIHQAPNAQPLILAKPSL